MCILKGGVVIGEEDLYCATWDIAVELLGHIDEQVRLNSLKILGAHITKCTNLHRILKKDSSMNTLGYVVQLFI